MSLAVDHDYLFPVTLETPVDEFLRLLGLTRRSNTRLYNAGQDCELRWRSESSCLACPLNQANNPSSAKYQLCRTSTQEEHLETVLAAKQSDGG